MNDESKDLLTQFIDYTIERTAKLIPSTIKYIEFESGLQHIKIHYEEQINDVKCGVIVIGTNRFSMRLVALTGSRDVDDVRFQNISYLRSFNSDVA
uniref:Uncharacterized protein n=1 Tax=Glossina palpalis gambiensis TaxID=67801 RepID=A0A1B0AW30_9MUSC